LAINPNPVDEQMTALTQVGPQPIAPTSVGTQTQPSVPPGFTPKPQTTAQSILQSEGISSSRQLLDSMKVPSAKDILASAGITSTADILGGEKKRQDAQTEWQKEMDLKEKEKEFMKDFKFSPDDFNATVYDTKFGKLDLKEATVGYDTGWADQDLFYTYLFRQKIPKPDNVEPGWVSPENQDFVFLPESVITNGIKGKDNAQKYNYGFLDPATMEYLKNHAQYIDMSDTNMSKLNLTNYTQDPNREFTPESAAKLERGFLFDRATFQSFSDSYLKGKWRSWGSLNPDYGSAKGKYGTDIKGIAKFPNDTYVYMTQPSGGHDQVVTYLNNAGEAYIYWYDAPKRKTVLQKVVGAFGDLFNAIPFSAELLVIATGGAAAPYYPSIKGAQTVAAGGDLGQTVTSIAIAALPQSGVVKGITDSTTSYIATNFGVETVTAEVMASAVVSAGFNGSIAALTGQDVEKAIIAGALTGGIQAGIPAVAKELFKDVDVSGVAESLNMTTKQFQNVLVSSVGNAAVSSAVYNRDFFETFSQTLVTSGLSVSAANKVASQFESTADPKKVQQAVNLTRATVSAGARSAIRGTDFNIELERSLTGLVSSTVKKEMAAATEQKK